MQSVIIGFVFFFNMFSLNFLLACSVPDVSLFPVHGGFQESSVCFCLHTVKHDESAVIFTSTLSLISPRRTVTVLWTVNGCCYHGDHQVFSLYLRLKRA